MEQNSAFLLLVAYRSTLAVFGIYSVVAKPFWTAVLALFVLGFLLLIGEGFYKSKIAYDEQMLRFQKARELREARAEEARLRLEAFKKAQEESAEKFMVFENEQQSEAVAESIPASSEGELVVESERQGH